MEYQYQFIPCRRISVIPFRALLHSLFPCIRPSQYQFILCHRISVIPFRAPLLSLLPLVTSLPSLPQSSPFFTLSLICARAVEHTHWELTCNLARSWDLCHHSFYFAQLNILSQPQFLGQGLNGDDDSEYLWMPAYLKLGSVIFFVLFFLMVASLRITNSMGDTLKNYQEQGCDLKR